MISRPLPEKWRSFGWRVLEVDGHCVPELLNTLDEATTGAEGPTVIIAHTVKGKGVSFMEKRWEWHGKPISPEDRDRALDELRGKAR